MAKVFINGKIIMEDEIIKNKYLVFDEDILEITGNINLNDYEVIDLEGKYISPGFVDIHIHGSNGSDVMDGTKKALDNIAVNVAKNGVTSFLATTMTHSSDEIKKAFEAIKSYIDNETVNGAKIVGIHAEGPFINKEYKGAQNDSYIVPPDHDLVGDYLDYIKLITVAPEIKGVIDFVKETKLKNHSVRFSIGHSGATYEQAIEGYEAGIDSTTHIFNSMTGLHHRKPGIIGAVLKVKPYFEIIADNVHLHSALYDIMGDCVGKDKMILVTDAMCACNMKPGVYEFSGQKVIVDENSTRLENGNLAGSVLKLNSAILNVLNNTKYELYEVVNMATLNPANMLGIENIGRLKSGCKADFAVFDDQLEIYMTVVNGNIVFRAE